MENLLIYGLARKALPGALSPMSGAIDYGAIDLVLSTSGVEEDKYSDFFTGVVYYLLSYRSSQSSKQPGHGQSVDVSSKRRVLGKK